MADGAEGVTIAGGGYDSGSHDRSHVTYDDFGTIGGGYGNQVGASDGTGFAATVGGGYANTASGTQATVAGGKSNTASGRQATVAGGGYNTASGTNAMILGGKYNEASGLYSSAAGYNALASKDASFVWNGSKQFNEVESPAPSTFSVQAENGIWLGTDYDPSIDQGRFIDTSTGAYLNDSGVWTDSCSVTEKERFRPTDSIDVIEKVDSLEVSTWEYIDDDGGARHMGPTAEQFHDTFGLGDDERHIASLDTAGVALTAIQGL